MYKLYFECFQMSMDIANRSSKIADMLTQNRELKKEYECAENQYKSGEFLSRMMILFYTITMLDKTEKFLKFFL